MTDYEDALANSLRSVFGHQVQLSGCLFHYTQALIRKFRQMGLSREIRNAETTQLVLRCLISLPLLPTAEIQSGFQDIQVEMDNNFMYMSVGKFFISCI